KLDAPKGEEERWNPAQGHKEVSATAEADLAEKSPEIEMSGEEAMLLKALEERYGRLNLPAKQQVLKLMRRYGCTRVSIAMFTLTENKDFPMLVVDFLEKHLTDKDKRVWRKRARASNPCPGALKKTVRFIKGVTVNQRYFSVP